MTHKFQYSILLIFILIFFNSKKSIAGAACTFSDNCTSAATFTFCSTVLADNTSCDGCGHCDPLNDTFTPAGGQPDWGNNDQCDNAWANGGCGGTYTDPCGECANTLITCMAAIASCAGDYMMCGSPENTSYSKVCVPATYVGSCAYTFSVSSISCSGGGATLQWGIYPAGSDAQCGNLATNWPNATGMLFCDGSQTANQTSVQTLVPGSCYLVFFDGNAEAACTWTYGVTAPAPTAGTVTPATSTIACGGCVTFTGTATCYNTRTWTTSDGQTSTALSPSFCWASPGTYTVTETVSSGVGSCIGTATTTPVTVTVSCCVPPTLTIASTNVLCFGACTGSADATVSGGTAPYTYKWTNGPTTQDQIGTLCAGTYTLTVTESGGCKTNLAVIITQPASALTATISSTNVSCTGSCNGSADLTPGGGTGAYTYSWSNGITTQDQIGTLCAGTYTATVRDANNCFTTATVTFTPPLALTATITSTNVLCFGACTGSADLTPGGGTGAYTYRWSNGITTQDQLGTLCAGTYTATVKDANGCLTTASVIITQPATALTAATLGTNITCNGLCNGSASISGSGGTGAFTYTWSNGGSGASITSLCAATYTGTVTDANGCKAFSTIAITQPATLTASFTKSTSACPLCMCKEWALFAVSGGTLPITYSWSNGYSDVYQNLLCPGAYSATAIDANGCTANSSTVLP